MNLNSFLHILRHPTSAVHVVDRRMKFPLEDSNILSFSFFALIWEETEIVLARREDGGAG